MENSQCNVNLSKDVVEHIEKEMSCALPAAQSCADQHDDETKQQITNVTIQMELPDSFVVETTESIVKPKTKTDNRMSYRNSRAERSFNIISSILKQNRWQKVRYLPTRLFMRRINAKKIALYKSKCKCQNRTNSKGQYVFIVKKCKCLRRQRDENGKNSSWKSMSLEKRRVNADQCRCRSWPQVSTRQVKDVSTNTLHCMLSDAEVQTVLCDVTTRIVGTQTDERVHHLDKPYNVHFKYQCDFCKKCYKSKNVLEKHIKKHIQTLYELNSCYCKTCDRHFENSSLLENHMCVNNNTTAGPMITFYDDLNLLYIPVYKCGNCDAHFLTEGCYNEHKSKFHDAQEKLYTCIFCSEMLRSDSALHAHLENHLTVIVKDN